MTMSWEAQEGCTRGPGESKSCDQRSEAVSETLNAHGVPSAASEAPEAPIDPAEHNLKHAKE